MTKKKRIKASGLEFKEKLVGVNRVVKVVKGGRNLSFTALVVIGDEKGTIGHGLGKSKQVPDAIKKATNNARRNLIKIPIQGYTIPHRVIGKFKGGHVLLKRAKRGAGIIAGGGVRKILETSGIPNVSGKIIGSTTNHHNVIKATFKALSQLRNPLMVAEQRGISLHKVFNG